jgi:phosphate transport system protein
LQRIAINEKNYIKNMQICQSDMDEEMKRVIKESLSMNRNTIKALEFVMEMVKITDDAQRLKDLAGKINVENSKSDDIYTMIEKDALQSMHQEGGVNEEMINLLKYIRKNAKILDRLEDIASRLLFARIGGKL